MTQSRCRRILSLSALVALVSALPAAAQNIPPYKTGFPLTLPGEATTGFSKPLLADLKITGGKVGVKSIIFGNDKGNLHVIYQRASDNAWLEAPGFPVTVCPAGSCSTVGKNSLIYSSPAAGDLTGDGIPEIVVGYGNQDGTSAGGVKAFRNNGQLLWTRVSGNLGIPDAGGRPDPVVGTPAIGDVDGDGLNDVVWGSIDQFIYFVRGSDGANKPNWPRWALDTIWSSPVLHDMDGDGKLEIIIGVDAHADAQFGIPGNGGCLHVIPGAQPPFSGTYPDIGYPQNLPGFPRCVDQVIFSAPSVGDIDGDGRPEIVHGTGAFFGTAVPGNPSERVYAWKCDGTAVPGWPVTISGQVGTSPALGNLDNDPALEVVVTADNTRSSNTFRVYAFKGNGSIMSGFPRVPVSFQGSTPNAADPIIADVLGNDSTPEILVPVNFEASVISNTGQQLTASTFGGPEPSFRTLFSVAGVAVADLDPGDGKIEVVAVSSAPFPAATDQVVHVWNPISRTATPPWGQFRQGESRRGVAPGTGPCRTYGACSAAPGALRLHTVTPCRAVDTRTGAALSSGALRDFVLRGVCNVPSTAKALSLNLTVVTPSNQGFVRFSPSCTPPLASTINFGVGQTRANNAVLLLGDTDGILTANAFVAGSGAVHLLIDINGYFQ